MPLKVKIGSPVNIEREVPNGKGQAISDVLPVIYGYCNNDATDGGFTHDSLPEGKNILVSTENPTISVTIFARDADSSTEPTNIQVGLELIRGQTLQ